MLTKGFAEFIIETEDLGVFYASRVVKRSRADHMTRFSVIVPTRDRPKLLERALSSISEQSFEAFEVLVVDDGSEPEAADLMEELVSDLGPRFQIVRRNPASRHGPGAARNEGIRRANGEYVAFLDDDDHWSDPEHLRIAADYLQTKQGSEIDVYVANQVARRGEVVVLSTWLPHLAETARLRPSESEEGVVRLGLADFLVPRGIGFVHVNMTVARRETVVATGGFWEHGPYEEDLNFFLRLFDIASGFAYRPDTVAVHTVRDSGAGVGASSIGARNKPLLRLLACQHAELACKRSETRRYARLLQGGVWKTLAKEAYETGDLAMAAHLARRATAVDPSLRWRLIAIGLRTRSLLGR